MELDKKLRAILDSINVAAGPDKFLAALALDDIEAIRQAADTLSVARWIPVTESLPPREHEVEVLWPRFSTPWGWFQGRGLRVGTGEHAEWRVRGENWNLDNVAYWRELQPTPPPINAFKDSP